MGFDVDREGKHARGRTRRTGPIDLSSEDKAMAVPSRWRRFSADGRRKNAASCPIAAQDDGSVRDSLSDVNAVKPECRIDGSDQQLSYERPGDKQLTERVANSTWDACVLA
jgi:hypothetical protein